MLRGFKPFIDNQTVDILHPDLAFAGGLPASERSPITPTRIKMPLALHNVGSLVLTFANAHFGAAIHNFYRSESQLGETGYIEPMAASNPPEVRKSYLKVPTGPGLGFEIILTSSRRTSSPGKSTGASVPAA
jgi:L-alanine-DL-glutamate epimerase and related enzymes of enolase superfamily